MDGEGDTSGTGFPGPWCPGRHGSVASGPLYWVSDAPAGGAADADTECPSMVAADRARASTTNIVAVPRGDRRRLSSRPTAPRTVRPTAKSSGPHTEAPVTGRHVLIAIPAAQ
jgi:hypothetical protein